MTFIQFCSTYRLRPTRDICGDLYVIGREGVLSEYGPGRFAVTVTHEGPLTRASGLRWAARRRKCLAANMTLSADGDDEGSCTFSPTDKEQSRVAIRVAGCRVRRINSPAQLAAMAKHAFVRKQPATEGRDRPFLPTNASPAHEAPTYAASTPDAF